MDIPEEQLDKAKEILIDQARNEALISYSGLYDQIGLDRTKVFDRLIGSNILAIISKESLQEKGVMLSSLAFGRAENEPLEGFYDLAEELGKLKPKATEEQKYMFWVKETTRCYDAYGQK